MPQEACGTVVQTAEKINLSQPSTVMASSISNADIEITLGDLHGNTLNLLHKLMREGVINISPAYYSALASIYLKEAHEITAEDLALFRAIVAHSITVNPVRLVRLLGDDVADRGKNDYFMLILLAELQKKNLPLEILLSNHSAVLHYAFDLIAYYKKMKPHGRPSVETIGKIIDESSEYVSPVTSLKGLEFFLTHEIVSLAEIEDLVWNFYRPATKLISYTLLDNGDINLYTHAPVGFETIKGLADYYSVSFQCDTAQQLATTIDQINQEFQKDLCSGKFILNYFGECSSRDYSEEDRTFTSPISAPHWRLIWNREQASNPHYAITFPSLAYKVNVIHGHIGPRPLPNWQPHPNANFYGLDSLFGKASQKDAVPQEGYVALRTVNSQPVPRPTPKRVHGFHVRQLPEDLRLFLEREKYGTEKTDVQMAQAAVPETSSSYVHLTAVVTQPSETRKKRTRDIHSTQASNAPPMVPDIEDMPEAKKAEKTSLSKSRSVHRPGKR